MYKIILEIQEGFGVGVVLVVKKWKFQGGGWAHVNSIRGGGMNIFWYYTIRDLFSNMPNCYVGWISSQSYGVQIPHDICTRFRRYLYSTNCSLIIIASNIDY